jgi:toxin ParE1/3/4
MAELIWTEPALQDLDAVADYIALDNRDAARRYVREVLDQVARLKSFPESGQVPAELEDFPQYRHLVIPPCRVFYKVSGSGVFILHVMRCERRFRTGRVLGRGVDL